MLREQVKKLRQPRWPYHAIAHKAWVSRSTVARILKAASLHRRLLLEPKALPSAMRSRPLVCFCIWTPRSSPGSKDRDTGVTGDRRRSSPRAGYGDERKERAVSFLLSALRHYRRLGVRVRAVMTDHAPMFRSRKFKRIPQRLGIRHRWTPPYTPRVNGNLERFIRTLLNEGAYTYAYPSSEARNAYLPEWLHFYNWHRPHTRLVDHAPVSKLGLGVNNVVKLQS